MYAVIQTGGKQYRVSKGDKLRVELLEGDVGKKLSFDALLVGGEGEAKVGKPTVTSPSPRSSSPRYAASPPRRKGNKKWLTKRDRAPAATDVTPPGSDAA
jgi:large subunit ribosomal protein L21